MTTATKEAPAEPTLADSVKEQKETKTLPPLETGNRGVELSTFEEMWRFAQSLAASELAPKDYRGKPDNALVAIQLGLEVGLPPMSAIQNIAVINGRPTIWGDAMLAVCQRSPVFDHASFREEFDGADDKKDDFAAVCYVSRLGRVDPIVSRFSVGDAKRANLWGKQGPWTQYPKRMLKMRARAFALRDGFADVLKGLYATEELTAESVLSGIDTAATGEDLRARLTAPSQPPATTPKRKPPEKKPEPEAEEAVDEKANDEAQTLIMEILKLKVSADIRLATCQNHGVRILKECTDTEKLKSIALYLQQIAEAPVGT